MSWWNAWGFFKSDKTEKRQSEQTVRIFTNRNKGPFHEIKRSEDTVGVMLPKIARKHFRNSAQNSDLRIVLTNETKKGGVVVSSRVLNYFEKIFVISDQNNLENSKLQFFFEDLNEYQNGPDSSLRGYDTFATEKPTDIEREGYFDMASRKSKGWKKKHFRLTKDYLYYNNYNDEKKVCKIP